MTNFHAVPPNPRADHPMRVKNSIMSISLSEMQDAQDELSEQEDDRTWAQELVEASLYRRIR